MNIWPSVEESGFDLFVGFLGIFSVKVFTNEAMPSDQILRGRKVILYRSGNRDEHGRWMNGEDMAVSFGPKELEIL